MGRMLLMAAVLVAWLSGAGLAEAAPQVIHAVGVYTMGDNDSPKIAKDAARQEAMRSAVEQAGVYVESYSKTHNMELTEDDVRMISGAVLRVIDERATPELYGNVMKYTVELTAEVDAENIDYRAMMGKRAELERLQQERDELKRQNEELLQRYERASGEEKHKIGDRLESQYTLGEIFDKCVAYIQRGDQHRAIKELTQVINGGGVYDSPLAYAYYLRGRAYYELNSDNYALENFDDAEHTPHDNSIYPIWRVHKYRGLIYYDRRDYEGAYYELKLAWDASPQDDEELWNAMQKAEARLSQSRHQESGNENNDRDDINVNWEKILGDIVIGAIQGRDPFGSRYQSQEKRPKVYHGTPRARIPV